MAGLQGFVALLVALLLCFGDARGAYSVPSACQPITIPLCKALPYNMTRLPNKFEQTSQDSVAEFISNVGIDTLVSTNCSDTLVFVLCVYLLPICTTQFSKPILPCRTLCQKVKSECMPTFKRFRRKWLSEVNCNELPTYENGVCIKPESFDNSGAPGSCACKKRASLGRGRVNVRRYDFVITAQVNKILTTANYRRISLNNVHTFRGGLTTRNKLTIYTNTSCPCPPLQNNRTYLLTGQKDARTKRLVLTLESFVCEWPKNCRKERRYRQIKRSLPYVKRHVLRVLEQPFKRKSRKRAKNITRKNKKGNASGN